MIEINKARCFQLLCVILVILVVYSLPVAAGENTGSIYLHLETAKKLKEGEENSFAVKKVADITNGKFVLTEAYAEAAVDINNISNASELEKTVDILKKIDTKTDCMIKIDKDGQGSVGELELGMYLIYPLGNIEKDVQPCLVSIPTEADTGEMTYDLHIYPKYAVIEKETTAKTGDNTPIYYYCFFIAGAVLLACLSLFQIYTRYKKSKR